MNEKHRKAFSNLQPCLTGSRWIQSVYLIVKFNAKYEKDEYFADRNYMKLTVCIQTRYWQSWNVLLCTPCLESPVVKKWHMYKISLNHWRKDLGFKKQEMEAIMKPDMTTYRMWLIDIRIKLGEKMRTFIQIRYVSRKPGHWKGLKTRVKNNHSALNRILGRRLKVTSNVFCFINFLRPYN